MLFVVGLPTLRWHFAKGLASFDPRACGNVSTVSENSNCPTRVPNLSVQQEWDNLDDHVCVCVCVTQRQMA